MGHGSDYRSGRTRLCFSVRIFRGLRDHRHREWGKKVEGRYHFVRC
jgi:hypothetical protein